MPDREPFDILILGPMALKRRGVVVPEPRTLDLKRLVEEIVADIHADPGADAPRFRVMAPDDRTANVIVPGVLDLIEQAELVILDLSRGRPNVTYEAALVHALGLPHILITEDRQPPFYFQPVEHIAGFRVEAGYDPALPSHAALRRKIVDAVTKPGVAADFARNQITEYFDVPIIDIAGPSGLAAGYYSNSVRRFVRPGGFFHAPRRIAPPARAVAGEALPEQTMQIGHYFAVSPPGGLMKSQGDDTRALQEALASRGLGLRFATIQRLPNDAEDMRDFGASLLLRGGELVEPVVVMEIPSTLYALQYAPRLRRLDKRVHDGVAKQVLDVLRQRHLQAMLASFAKNMSFQIDQDKRKEEPNRFHMITLDKLDDELCKIDILP
jgi:hypothetical protein